MQEKVDKGLGKRSDEEQRTLKSKIKTLEEDLDKKKDKKKMLVQQSKKSSTNFGRSDNKRNCARHNRNKLKRT